MSVIALTSVRSCAVTTLGVALAATWPTDRRAVLVELDPAGGTLAAAAGWPPEPGLVSLAAAARRDSDPALVWSHCQELPSGVPVLAGPASSERACTARGMVAGLIARLGELDADALVDCGRVNPGSPSLGVVEGVLAGADRVVLAARSCLADLHAVATWLETQPFDPDRFGLVLVGGGPYPDAEVAEALQVEVLARLPWDPDAAAALLFAPVSARELRAAPLVRAARSLADRLSGLPACPLDVGRTGGKPHSVLRVAPLTKLSRTRRSERTALSTNGSAPEGDALCEGDLAVKVTP